MTELDSSHGDPTANLAAARNSIAILGEYSASHEYHPATEAAIGHSAAKLGISIDSEWISTADVTLDRLREHSAVWVAPGSPYKDMEKTLSAIQYARERDVPFLGTCGGFQHLVLEYARNVLGMSEAMHGEYVENNSEPPNESNNLLVSRLDCSLVGREMLLRLRNNSRLAEIYGQNTATERYYCNFGVNPQHVQRLQSGALQSVASDDLGEIRALELPTHRFFFGTLYVPQSLSTAQRPHPLITSFVAAASCSA